jgi:hypothetical protein
MASSRGIAQAHGNNQRRIRREDIWQIHQRYHRHPRNLGQLNGEIFSIDETSVLNGKLKDGWSSAKNRVRIQRSRGYNNHRFRHVCHKRDLQRESVNLNQHCRRDSPCVRDDRVREEDRFSLSSTRHKHHPILRGVPYRLGVDCVLSFGNVPKEHHTAVVGTGSETLSCELVDNGDWRVGKIGRNVAEVPIELA